MVLGFAEDFDTEEAIPDMFECLSLCGIRDLSDDVAEKAIEKLVDLMVTCEPIEIVEETTKRHLDSVANQVLLVTLLNERAMRKFDRAEREPEHHRVVRRCSDSALRSVPGFDIPTCLPGRPGTGR